MPKKSKLDTHLERRIALADPEVRTYMKWVDEQRQIERSKLIRRKQIVTQILELRNA